MKPIVIIATALMILPWIPGKEIHYTAPKGERVEATVTAYTSSVDETDEDPWTTASGTTAGPGTIACPSKWPFGTRVEIEGKMYVCEDRMHARYRDKEVYDVWLPTKTAAREWGRRQLAILIHKNASN